LDNVKTRVSTGTHCGDQFQGETISAVLDHRRLSDRCPGAPTMVRHARSWQPPLAPAPAFCWPALGKCRRALPQGSWLIFLQRPVPVHNRGQVGDQNIPSRATPRPSFHGHRNHFHSVTRNIPELGISCNFIRLYIRLGVADRYVRW